MAYIGVPPADRTSGARVRDEFTADGTQVCFQLSQEVPGSFESNIIAVVENVIQEPVSAYTIVDTITLALTSISGTFTKNETITGGTSAATGTVIQVNTSNIVIKVSTGTFQTESITGGSSSATATISSRTTNIGRGLNFSGTPSTGVKIYALHQNSATYQLKPAAGSVTPDTLSENLRTFTVDKFTATSSQTEFTLSATPVSVKSILVFVDGVMQTETTHYTLSGVTLTIGASLTAGQQVSVVHLGFSTVSRTAFADGTVTTAMIADGAITSDKIATGGVVTIDMADGSVTSLKIADGGIATADIADSAITTAKIAAGAVATVDIADSAVTTAKIADANVTSGKLATDISITNLAYTGTLTGGTGVINLGTGQVYKDASGKVGIGTTTMTNRLNVAGAVQSSSTLVAVEANTVALSQEATYSRLAAFGPNSSTGGTLYLYSISSNGGVQNGMIIDPAGRVTKSSQPAFYAYSNLTSMTSAAKVGFNQAAINVGSCFNTSTNTFTAPIAGTYVFSAVVRYDQTGVTYAQTNLMVNGLITHQGHYNNQTSANSTYNSTPVNSLLVLAAGDTVHVRADISGGGTFNFSGSESGFYGYLLG